MPSSLSWLDFSAAERRKMMELIQSLRERDTRDELGLGMVRDVFADLLFPGTTTLQTRARYFLFVPWLYLRYEQQHLSGEPLPHQLLQDEIALIRALRASGETDGVIGQRSGASLHRFPSSIYWIGMQQWGILKFPGTSYQYCANLRNYYRRLDALKNADERQPGETVRPNWDVTLPKPQNDFLAQASFRLRREEAEYLCERLQFSCRDSMLAQLAADGQIVQGVDFAWLHPSFASFPERLQSRLRHARNFSETMAGSTLLYNLMLAEKRRHQDWIEWYRQRLETWRQMLLERQFELLSWDRNDFWKLVDHGRIPLRTQRFISEWISLLLGTGHIVRPENQPEMRRIVQEREEQLKGGRSRFRSSRHLELWGGDAGTGQLNYRWFVANRLINDILLGLAEGE